MERFDFEEEPVARSGPRLNILDVFTALVLMLTVAVGAVLLYVFIRPDTPINPLRPKIPTPFEFPTATITPLQMEATWTPTFIVATDTATLAPTITPLPPLEYTVQEGETVGGIAVAFNVTTQSILDLNGLSPTTPLQIAYRGLHTTDPVLRGTALEYLEGVLPPDIRDRLREASGLRTFTCW